MPVSWVCKRQGGVFLSTIKVKFTAASMITWDLLDIHELLQELSLKFEESMTLRVDTQADLKRFDGEKTSAKTKHIDVRIKFVVVALSEDYKTRVLRYFEYACGYTIKCIGWTKTG